MIKTRKKSVRLVALSFQAGAENRLKRIYPQSSIDTYQSGWYGKEKYGQYLELIQVESVRRF
ncbi:hypothetical protein [Cylindrospermopsis curvispora]|uniref:Uncharacterized protein n=1 Tax=Cylindrospermopsis curvispora GIHE-G1 TaxID=2666332 RepID=A0A7H0EXI6_9CYAN|nr:hypothetical protein [Cylindrospermopsis curvispora]QNP28502.1 hypothetical protein IAR63_11315 [Cylindrospermopsis curvispora GIHE-G1]